MNASFVTDLSSLSAQLAKVGSEEVNGTFKYIPPSNSSSYTSPGFYVLIFNNTYDIVPIPIANKSYVLSQPPSFVYIGAQGCPFCALMRWSIAIALSRFGNFSKLFYDRSATNDYNVPTFMFNFSKSAFLESVSAPPIDNAPAGDYPSSHTPVISGSYYSSPYIQFEPFDELGTSFLNNETGIEKLNQTIFAKVLVPAVKGFGIKDFVFGGVPFFDINNQYVFDGAIINVSSAKPYLGDNATQGQILASIENPAEGSIGQTELGAANLLTADICMSINNTAPVCKLGYIEELESKLSALNYTLEYS